MNMNSSSQQISANFRKLYVFQFLLSLHFFGGVMVVFFTEWGKISFTQIMFLQSAYVFFGFLLEVPTGVVADWLGRKLTLAVGAFFLMLAALCYASYPNFWVFVGAEFLWAISAAFISGADQAMIYDSLKALGRERESQKIFARYQNAQLSGLLISAPVGSVLADWLGLRFSMLLIALPALMALWAALRLYEPDREDKPEVRFKASHFARTMKVGFQTLRQDPTLRILAFDRVVVVSLGFLLIWLYQPMLEKLHVPLTWFGVVSAGLTGMQILLISRLAFLERQVGSARAFLILTSMVCGICYILLGVTTHAYFAVGLMILGWGFGASRMTLYQGHINKHVGSAHRATVLSSISMMEKIFRAVVYPLAGWLFERSMTGVLVGLGTAIILTTLTAVRRIRDEDLQPVTAS